MKHEMLPLFVVMVKHLRLARYKAKLDTAYLDYGLSLQIYPYLHYKH